MKYFTDRFDKALQYASEAHREQSRKSATSATGGATSHEIPYLGHLLGVASIVIDAGASEDEAIAALLHDVAEDQGGEPRLNDVARAFGDRVEEIVRGCSDSLTVDPKDKAPWRERKERYIAHLVASKDISVYLISAADKCHNARATARDLAFTADHRDVWGMFNPAAGPAGTLWYYRALIAAYRAGPPDSRRDRIVYDLVATVDEIERAIEREAQVRSV